MTRMKQNLNLCLIEVIFYYLEYYSFPSVCLIMHEPTVQHEPFLPMYVLAAYNVILCTSQGIGLILS